jgi:integrase
MPAPSGQIPPPWALFRRRFWLPATRAAGLGGLRIHDLRHTAVALWIAAGANPKEVAARAGHASVSFTLDRYGHLYPEADLSLRERLERSGRPAEADRESSRPQQELSGYADPRRRRIGALTCKVGWWA